MRWQNAVKRSFSGMLTLFHPVVQRWFVESLGKPTPAQEAAWPQTVAGRHTLLLAPTGSGKTLAAFLAGINRLIFERPDAEPAGTAGSAAHSAAGGVKLLYVSPLKALGADVERNLLRPLDGLEAVAAREGVPFHRPQVGIRSGDTSAKERAAQLRRAPEILITTPESLYLLLTSQARRLLRSVETIIVDEIHTLVATKRGAHLFVSLERLEEERRKFDPARPAAQRIGLSATLRPLDEAARLLGGAEAGREDNDSDRLIPVPRPVEIVAIERRRSLELSVEVPVEDMAQPAGTISVTPGAQRAATKDAAATLTLPSIWPAIFPRLVELIRSHRSTLVFANSRRLAERIAAAINQEAGEELALAHHGSIAKEARRGIEERLKRGELPAIVATSSLELGIDMGAIDLVVQMEAPPSVSAGLQRIGRSGHHIGGVSEGVLFPKFRGDLLACAAAVERMRGGDVETSRPLKNPLDVLAQQVVAIVAGGRIHEDQVLRIIRRAAPFHDLPRAAFDGVLDLLSGRYPSDEFSGMRPCLFRDDETRMLMPRRGTQRLAILNGGTIPDRGLYGVFFQAEADQPASRVGELDEEMVFECRVGDVIQLGATTWRIIEITHDRVLVLPAPGEPGRMPFWRGEGPGRPLEFGEAIGALIRRLLEKSRAAAETQLREDYQLNENAARNLMSYLHEQRAATGDVPHDRMVLIECFRDETRSWRVAVLSPFGQQVLAPLAMVMTERLRERSSGEVDVMWTADGILFRLPGSDERPDPALLFPSSDEVETLVVKALSGTSLFAARFREAAGRALLLPRRAPGRRTPLWLQRRKAADLLRAASKYPAFPILLEAYRECLRDLFDLEGLRRFLQRIEDRQIDVRMIETDAPSPFASSLMFSFTGTLMYSGDVPLAERRAQTLHLDQSQLRQLLGSARYRELLDPDVIAQVEQERQRLDGRFPVRDAEGLHDLLRTLGDLSLDELAARAVADCPALLQELADRKLILEIKVAGDARWIIVEDAVRYRDGLGVKLPRGTARRLLQPVDDPLLDLVARYARTHGPFTTADVQTRFGVEDEPLRSVLLQLERDGRIVAGEFRPGCQGAEWCDVEVLGVLKRRSLAALRRQIEPVSAAAFVRFQLDWQSITRPKRGLDGLLDVIEQLQGLSFPVSVLERDILPARLEKYRRSDLDELCAAGEVIWQGAGEGRVKLFLADRFVELSGLPMRAGSRDSRTDCDRPGAEHAFGSSPDTAGQIRELLRQRGALFFDAIHAVTGGFRNEVLQTLWELVWSGEITNDSFRPVRSVLAGAKSAVQRPARRDARGFRSRRSMSLPGSEGRWSLLPESVSVEQHSSAVEAGRLKSLVELWLKRYGLVTKELLANEDLPGGGYAPVYRVLRLMEEAGRIRCGLFVAGMGAAQCALPGVADRLRESREALHSSESASRGVRDSVEVHHRNAGRSPACCVVLSALDPAWPGGTAVEWPAVADEEARPQRAAGARVVVLRGELIGYLNRSGERLTTFLPSESEVDSHRERLTALVEALAGLTRDGTPLTLTQIDGQPAQTSVLAPVFERHGFVNCGAGLIARSGP